MPKKLPERPAELIELETRYAKFRTERKQIETELRRIDDDAWTRTQADVDPVDVAAECLAVGDTEATSRSVLPEQTIEMRSRRDLLHLAIQKVAARVAEQSARHNRNVAAIFRPEHKQAAQRIADALRELVDANRAEEEIRGKAPGATLPAMNFPGVGQLGAAGGPAQYWLTWAARHGYLADEDEAGTRFPAAAL